MDWITLLVVGLLLLRDKASNNNPSNNMPYGGRYGFPEDEIITTGKHRPPTLDDLSKDNQAAVTNLSKSIDQLNKDNFLKRI